MTDKIIVYHRNCWDGITALWAALRSPLWSDAASLPGKHGEPPNLELLRGKDVLVVDFSWKRKDVERLHEVANSLLILDHHATAEKDLHGLPYCIFDMNRSGAGITWDELVDKPRPALVSYVEDTDLWRFSLPNAREIRAAVQSYPMDLTIIDALAKALDRGAPDLQALRK